MLSKCILLSVLPATESKHMAVELSIATTDTGVAAIGAVSTVSKAVSFEKYRWDEEKKSKF